MDEPALAQALNELLSGSVPHYTLEGHTPVKATDFLAWAAWYNTVDRHVALDRGEGWELSTVFLGLGPRYPDDPAGMESVPALFETALFKEGRVVRIFARYTSWEGAERGHAWYLGVVRAQAGEEGSGGR
jgi:hypothetical protein